MFCELKQTVPLLERELTPAEIRIGRGTPSWVAETGIPTFYHPVQTSDPASGLRVRPHRFDDRAICHGYQTSLVMAMLIARLTTGRFVTVTKLLPSILTASYSLTTGRFVTVTKLDVRDHGADARLTTG